MENLIIDLKTNENIINKIVLSETKGETKKIIAKKISLKGEIKWQIEKFVNNQVFHLNSNFDAVLALNFADFRQIMVEKTRHYQHIFKNKR